MRRKREGAFALLMVILILVGMLVIGVPFAVSMRLSSSRSRTALANARARFAAEGAFNHAIACLMRTQELHDLWPRTRVRPADTTFFESHTLDIPAELAVDFEDDAEPDLNLNGELPTRDPRGTIWSVSVEDEQGKINLNSASRHLLENLLYLLGPDVPDDTAADQVESARREAAHTAASELLAHRKTHGGFHTVSEAVTVLQGKNGDEGTDDGENTGPFRSGQLLGFRRYVTASSEKPNSEVPHPININTAPQVVLIANMMDLRLLTLAARAGGENKGNGSLSPITISPSASQQDEQDQEDDGDWKLEFTDADNAGLFFRAAREGASWGLRKTVKVGERETVDGISFTIYPGTLPFDEGDVFHFSTRRVTEELARDLAAAIQAEVKLTAGQAGKISALIGGMLGGPSGPLGNNEGQLFRADDSGVLGNDGHAAIGSDVMGYYALGGDEYLFFNHDKVYEEGQTFKVRRIIPHLRDLGTFTNVVRDHVREGYEAGAVESLLAALKLNALRPLSSEIDGATAPFCFTTSDVYTITARGSVNDSAGNELGVRGVRKTISIKRPIPVAEDDAPEAKRLWTVDTESAFDQLVTGKSPGAFRAERSNPDIDILNMPHNYRPEDDGRITLPSVSLASRELWEIAVRPTMVQHFGADLAALSNAINEEITPLSGVPYAADRDGTPKMQYTSVSGTSEDGIFFMEGGSSPSQYPSWPRLAYSTRHVPIATANTPDEMKRICRCIEMWVKPDDWSDPDRDYFLFDTTRPYHKKPVEEWSSMSSLWRTLELQQTPYENRIALFYSGASQELVFRVADATQAQQAAEIRCHFEPEPGTWHHIKAIWSGMDYGEMTLLIDGRAPDGKGGNEEGNGKYSPKLDWGAITGIGARSARRPVLVRNLIFEPSDLSTPIRGSGGVNFNTPEAGDPVTIYGYEMLFLRMHYESDPEDPPAGFFNNLGAYGGGRLASGLAVEPRTTVEPSRVPGGEIGPDATSIPVDSTEGFQDKGFLRIGDEIVYYESRSDESFDEVIRGVDVHAGGFGPSENVGSTGVATEPQTITTDLDVVPISIWVTDNRRYPTPRYFSAANEDIGSAAGFFGIGMSPKNYIRIDDEFIGYTHKPGREFLVDVGAVTNPGSTMRAQLGTEAADHAPSAVLRPVYHVDNYGHPGGPGPGDMVTVIDDELRPDTTESQIYSVSPNRDYVSFAMAFASCKLDKHARILKFPSGEFNLGTFFSIGTNSGPKAAYEADANPFRMDKQAEATIDEVKVCEGENSIRSARVVSDDVPASGEDRLYILHPYFWHPDFEISGLNGSAVQAWPTCGYAQINDEIIYYRALFRHNVTEFEYGAGPICAPSNDVFVEEAISEQADSIRWSAGGQGGNDPEAAGFNKDGGYLTIFSRTPRTRNPDIERHVSNAAIQDLIEAGFLTEEQFTGNADQNGDGVVDDADKDADGKWMLTRDGGYSGGGYKQELISYATLTGEGGSRVFSGLTRGLFGTKAVEHQIANNEEDPGQPLYPRLIANTVELQIIQRSCLGTIAKRHPVGSRITPLYHTISAFMTKPLATGDNRLYVESHANFPYRGYLLVSDGTKQEIIGYTGKSYDDGGPYFSGVGCLRRRFGTPLVDLNFDAPASLDDLTPDDEHSRRGVVRLYEPRYDDRLPVDPETGRFVSDVGSANWEGNPAYLEISRTIRGARWESVKWVEGPAKARDDGTTVNPTWDNPAPGRDDTGTEMFILARVDGEPDWSEEAMHWEAYQRGIEFVRNAGWGADKLRAAASRIVLFNDPAEDNILDRAGDTLELRIYFRYNSNYADQNTGRIKRWVSPVLRGLKIGYTAPSSVYQQEEVRF